MAICDRGGLPIAVHVASASPYEPHLVPATLDARFLPDLPWCLIGDRGYDSDGLDDLLMTQYGIEMIAANRRGRAKTQVYGVVKIGPRNRLPLSPFAARAPFAGEGCVLSLWTAA